MKALLFDLDGTLLNTLEDLVNAVNRALSIHGWPERSMEEVRRFVGNGVRRLMELAVPEGTSAEAMEACLATMRSYYEAHNTEKTAPYDGVLEVLAELKRMGIPMALVSNKPDGPVARLAEEYFPGIFTVTVGDSPLWARKPAPDMPLYALGQLGINREEAIYIGDSEVDFQTACNAGLPILSVSWGFRDREQLAALGPDWMVDTPAELLALIKEIWPNCK